MTPRLRALGRAALFLGSASVASLYPRAASASIALQIPSECGLPVELEGTLRERLGSAVSLDTTRLSLTPELSGYRLVVEVGEERRELHDADCRELLRAAVVIALALLQPAREEVPLAPSPAVLADAKPVPSPGAPPRFVLGAVAGGDWGTVPQPTLLLGVEAAILVGRFGWVSGVRYLSPASVLDERNHGARVSGVAGQVAGCFRPWPRVEARLGLAVYRLFGTGLGSFTQRTDAAWEAGPTWGGSFGLAEGRPFSLSLGAEGQLNLLRARFEIRDYGRVFETPWVSGSAFVRGAVVW